MADTVTSLEAELAEVKAALSKARQAVSVKNADIAITRAYESLMKEREKLEEKIALISGNSAYVSSADMSGSFNT